MAFCANCGTQLPEGVNFCPGCGAPTSEASAQNAQTAQQANPNMNAQASDPDAQSPNAGAQAADKINDTISKLTDTADTTSQYAPQDIEQGKILALFSYIGILFLIPLFAAKDSKFARFHVNQGIVLFIVDLLYGVVASILGVIFGLIPVIGTIGSILLGVVGLVPFALMIFGIVNAVSGRAKELPVIGQIRIIK